MSRADIDDMIVTVQLWGWDAETAFIAALQLAAAGVTARQARWMFWDGLKRLQ